MHAVLHSGLDRKYKQPGILCESLRNSVLHAAGVVYNAQRINSYLQEHWKAFARQPYFDDQGIFISAMVSAPLLLIMLVQLVSCNQHS